LPAFFLTAKKKKKKKIKGKVEQLIFLKLWLSGTPLPTLNLAIQASIKTRVFIFGATSQRKPLVRHHSPSLKASITPKNLCIKKYQPFYSKAFMNVKFKSKGR
jgi:hypothetical protein